MKDNKDNAEPNRAFDPLDELLRQAQWPDVAQDPLDDLLRMAQWPEPRAMGNGLPALPSLVKTPVSTVTERRTARSLRKVWTLAGLATAAAVLVAVAVWGPRFPGNPSANGPFDQTVVGPTQEASKPVVTTPQSAPQPTAVSQTHRVSDLPSIVYQDSKPFTIPPAMQPGGLRLQMLLARSRPRWQSKEDELLDRALAQRTIDPQGNLQQLVQPLLAQRAEYERRLLERINTLTDSEAAAALEFLGCLGSEAAVPTLVCQSHRPSAHKPAVRALVKIANAKTLAWLLSTEPDSGLRQEILAALSAQDDKQTFLFVLTSLGERPCLESEPSWY
jgi:hypothetical protein